MKTVRETLPMGIKLQPVSCGPMVKTLQIEIRETYIIQQAMLSNQRRNHLWEIPDHAIEN